MLTLHTAGGETMLAEAATALQTPTSSGPRTRLLGVTILTSLKGRDLTEIGIQRSVEENVLRRAHLAARAGLDGIVASPREITTLRGGALSDLLIVTPGIRPDGHPLDDQARVATPQAAIADGADFLVVGRPITQSPDPVAAARAICEDMRRAKIRN